MIGKRNIEDITPYRKFVNLSTRKVLQKTTRQSFEETIQQYIVPPYLKL